MKTHSGVLLLSVIVKAAPRTGAESGHSAGQVIAPVRAQAYLHVSYTANGVYSQRERFALLVEKG